MFRDLKEYAVDDDNNSSHVELQKRLDKLEGVLAKREENPVQLLENPPRRLDPLLSGAIGGVAAAAIDLVTAQVSRGTVGLVGSALAKAAAGWAITKFKPAWTPVGTSLLATAGYQGVTYATEAFFARRQPAQLAEAPPPAALPGPEFEASSEGYVLQAPPGYQYVPGVGFVPAGYGYPTSSY